MNDRDIAKLVAGQHPARCFETAEVVRDGDKGRDGDECLDRCEEENEGDSTAK